MTSPQDFSFSTFHKSATDFTGLDLRNTSFSGRLQTVSAVRATTVNMVIFNGGNFTILFLLSYNFLKSNGFYFLHVGNVSEVGTITRIF